jgi:hypothetical protein
VAPVRSSTGATLPFQLERREVTKEEVFLDWIKAGTPEAIERDGTMWTRAQLLEAAAEIPTTTLPPAYCEVLGLAPDSTFADAVTRIKETTT